MKPDHPGSGLVAKGLLTVGLSLAVGRAYAAAPAGTPPRPDSSAPWKVDDAHGPDRDLLEPDEGTWISLDVSPDGKTVVFSLLGDLYLLPLAGGVSTSRHQPSR